MDDVLLQYGAVGFLALISIAAVRILFQREINAHQRETTRADRLEEELRNLNETVQNQYLSTLTQATLAISEALKIVREIEHERRNR